MPGQIIDGKFRIERVVGTGGMGIVVAAINVHLDQRVALKFLRQDIERSPAVVARFEREIRSAVKLRSEHVARVSDVGTHADFGPFMVMELLEGSTLAALLAAGPLPQHRAAEYVIHACEGLAEAHARGIVHQDVKPANLFLVLGTDGRPLVKVLDFGISKATLSEPRDIETETTGRTGSNMGTPHYLSPEQLRATKDVDLRADVWALGCVLFELVTGVRAFEAKRFTELVAKILEERRAEIPMGALVAPGIVEVIDRCLEKDREKRYANSAELAIALLPFARRRAHAVASHAVAHVADGGLDPHLAMPSSMPPPPAGELEPAASSPNLRAPGVANVSLVDSYEPPPPPRAVAATVAAAPVREKWPLRLVAVLAGVAIASLVLFLMRHRESAPSPPASTSAVVPAPSVSAAPNVPSSTEVTEVSEVQVAPPSVAAPSAKPRAIPAHPVHHAPPPPRTVTPAISHAPAPPPAPPRPNSDILRSR